ncbi:uncharacterized protein si:ch73-303b9.1 [Colossoma macropomum]|uniref:uncharacterized protein si:ch73-303b9.1 n=1 Tax=Colossoma macropomum TaxID=42526 RepID=UPI0018651417|nr:uncharacterized protein si:ch73-303b9.1 [Colossoma macropomum]
MEEERGRAGGAKNYEGPSSLSELDKGFLTDCSLSALSIEGIHLKPPKGIVVEYSEGNPAPPASFNPSSGVLSPLNAPSKSSLLSPSSTLTAGLNSLIEGKSSTPYERVTFQKPVLVSSLDLSCIDLTTSHPPWEVSLIRPALESPKPCLDSSKLESTWSPSYQSVPPALAEISSLIWSGTPTSKSAIEEYQRSRKESTFQDSNLRHAVLELTEEQQKSLARNLAI